MGTGLRLNPLVGWEGRKKKKLTKVKSRNRLVKDRGTGRRELSQSKEGNEDHQGRGGYDQWIRYWTQMKELGI